MDIRNPRAALANLGAEPCPTPSSTPDKETSTPRSPSNEYYGLLVRMRMTADINEQARLVSAMDRLNRNT